MTVLLMVTMLAAEPTEDSLRKRLDELEQATGRAASARETAEAKEAVGLFLCELGSFDEAEEWLRSALGELAGERDVMSMYVRCRIEQRLELYGDALRTSAGLVAARGELGKWAARSHARCLERLGRPGELLRFAAEHAPRAGDEEAWWDLVRARALVRLGRDAEAAEVCRGLCSKGGREAELAGRFLQALSLRPRLEKLAADLGVGREKRYVRTIIRFVGVGGRRMALPRERELTPVIARGLDEALEAFQPRPLLGVTVGGAGPVPVCGALVRAVERGSPAAKLGLGPGDVIVAFDGVDLSNLGLLARIKLRDLVGRASFGQKVRVRWRRGKEIRTGDVVLVDYTE